TASDDALPIQLRSTTGQVVAATGGPESGESLLPPRSDRPLYSRIAVTDDGFSYWVTAPVLYGDVIVGHITQRRFSDRSATLERVRHMIGREIELYVANEDGGDWASLDGGALRGAPDLLSPAGPFTYTLEDGTA